MPEEVEECVSSVLEDNPDYSESRAYAICNAQQKGYDDPEAVAAVAMRQEKGDWPGIHPAEETSDGRDHLLQKHADTARELTEELQGEEERVTFKARMSGPSAIFKVSDDGDDRFIIWGKASVELVDKEGDKITAGALKDALPQLLRRKRLSLQHSDQLVGDIRESFETDEPITVEVDGQKYKRSEFPTDVLKLGKDENPALYVAGEVWDDTRQARQAREQIEAGEIDSYSISGEAISSSTQVKGGDVYDKISEIDLSAVTLTEEGMNPKAKFGTVVKMSDDPISPSNPGGVSNPGVSVYKSNNDMSETEDDEPPNLSKDELRREFKSVLSESGFVTKDEVEELITREDNGDDEPSNASEAVADEDEDAEEKADKPDDEEGYEEEEPEPEPEPEEDEKAPEEEAEPVDPEEIEDPDDDEEAELDIEPEEDEELPPEEEAKGDVLSQLEEEGVPDDLVDAVSEYVGGDEEEELPEEEPIEPADEEPIEPEGEEPIEMEDEDEEDEDEEDGDMSKSSQEVFTEDMTDDDYLTASASIPSSDEIGGFKKSYEVSPDDDEDDDVEKEEGVNLEPSTLDVFYNKVEE